MRRTAMSERHLRRAGVMARVQAGELRVVDAAEAGDENHRGELAAGQGAGGAQPGTRWDLAGSLSGLRK